MEDLSRFQEAERQYDWYTGEAQAGRLSTESYRVALEAIRVTDLQGRLWMLQQGSRLWHLWLGDRWTAASPYPAPVAPAPARLTARAPVAASTAHQERTPPPRSAPVSNRAGCAAAAVRYAAITLVLFGLIGAALVMFVEDFPPEGLLGVGLAALISFAISLNMLNKHWEGEIVDLYLKRVKVSSGDDDDDEYRDVLFAAIQEPAGRIRNERAMPEWRVGMSLRKEQGKTGIEIVA